MTTAPNPSAFTEDRLTNYGVASLPDTMKVEEAAFSMAPLKSHRQR
jgi:hypothetical protein